MGGDEFVIVLNGVNEQSAAASEANAVLGMLTMPMRISARVITTSVSIGIALSPQDAGDLDTVLRNVDLAMYKAKESGRNNVQFFKAEMNMQVRRRVTMEHALRRALSGKQFVVHYHPLTEIATRRIVGLEALRSTA